MKMIFKQTLSAILAVPFFTIILCGIYPLFVWCGAQLLLPHQANGSLIESNTRKIVGSELLGQNFSGMKYFHSRPSAAGANGYDAANSGGSNLGPTSRKLMDLIKRRVSDYHTENDLAPDILVPGDAVTASGSGLDPHISPRNALLQATRVARERGIGLDVVKTEIAKATDQRSLGFLGEAGVNVLSLNLALDGIVLKHSP
jgi:K+-transporting ATPase ATPase C chain